MEEDGNLEDFVKQNDTLIKLQNAPTQMKIKVPEMASGLNSSKNNQGMTPLNPSSLNKSLNPSMPVKIVPPSNMITIPDPVSNKDDTKILKDSTYSSIPSKPFPGPQPNSIAKPETKILPSFNTSVGKQVDPIARPLEQNIVESMGKFSSNPIQAISYKNPSPTTINSSLGEFIDLLCKFSNIKEIIRNSSLEKLENIQVPEELRKSLCKKCNSIKVDYCLSCSHTECLRCFTSSISQLQTLSYSSFLQSICCFTCRLNYSSQDIVSVFGNNAYKKLLTEPFSKLCYKCNTKRPIISEFCSDLSCLHMCRSCYADELMFGASKCLCCNASFKNTEKTLQKTARCMKCGACGNFVEHCFRAIHSNHLLCYECLMITAEKKNCTYCNEALSREEKGILGMFINKACSICGKNKTITDIYMKSCCCFIVCTDCQSSNQVCMACKKVS